MAIVLTVVADGPAALAELWGHLGGNKAEVDIVGDEMFIAVDLTTPEPEPEAQVEEVLSHPIHRDGPWEDAEEAPEPDHDGHTVDVGQVEEVNEPEPSTGEPTLRDEIVAVLNRQPDRTFTVAEVYEHVDGSTTGSVGATLKWLVNNGRARRVARGQYQALDRSAVHDARRQAAAAAMYSS
jgi:hypothetical protein